MQRRQKCYLSGRYSRREELQGYGEELTKLGYDVGARWLTGAHEEGVYTKDKWAVWAYDDMDDVARAEIVVAFTEGGECRRGGRHVEFGMGLALGKVLVVVGPIENIFHTLTPYHFKTWTEAKEWLGSQASWD